MRQTIASGEEKDKAAMHFTVGVRRRDEAVAEAPGKLGSSACVGVLRLQREGQKLECELI
jgi:hypothetical protein